MALLLRDDYVGSDKCNWPYDFDFSPFINGENGMVPGLGQNEKKSYNGGSQLIKTSTPQRQHSILITPDCLRAIDDLATYFLLESIWVGITVRKNSSIGVSGPVGRAGVFEMIKKKVVLDRSPALAVSSLLELPEVKDFADSLADSDQTVLSRHLRLYTDIYLPGCPFQISTTTRYGTEEAAVIARTDINTGEILFLRGVLATFEEGFVPDWSQWDFSIMESSRYGVCSLMEGPLRFVNHDCYPNSRFESCATSEVKAIAMRRILVGEEITARYKVNMFGSRCLCETCVPQDPRPPSKPYNFRTRHRDIGVNLSDHAIANRNRHFELYAYPWPETE